jgi:hypothetical protein
VGCQILVIMGTPDPAQEQKIKIIVKIMIDYVKKGGKEEIKRAAAAAEENLNEYIVSSIYQRMEREGRSHMAPPGELEDSQVD